MLYKFLPLVSEMLWSISQHTVWKFEITVTKLFEKLLNMCSTNISLSNIPSLVFLHFYIKYIYSYTYAVFIYNVDFSQTLQPKI